ETEIMETNWQKQADVLSDQSVVWNVTGCFDNGDAEVDPKGMPTGCQYVSRGRFACISQEHAERLAAELNRCVEAVTL
ncbi:MAG: hypothetical protein JSU95_03855, partial [Betaproteobacteria bacterium]